MTDTHHLIQDRLKALDDKRKRAQLPQVYCYVAERVTGQIAVSPSKTNVRVVRDGDPLPDGTLIYSQSLSDLQAWFKHHTAESGPVFRRWREDDLW